MSNRLFQSVIHQMRDAVERTIGVIDETGAVISCSDLGRIGEVRDISVAAVFSSASFVSYDGYLYQAFGTHMHPEYAVFVEGDDALKAMSVFFAFLFQALNSIMMRNMTAQTLSKTLLWIISFPVIFILKQGSFILTTKLQEPFFL